MSKFKPPITDPNHFYKVAKKYVYAKRYNKNCSEADCEDFIQEFVFGMWRRLDKAGDETIPARTYQYNEGEWSLLRLYYEYKKFNDNHEVIEFPFDLIEDRGEDLEYLNRLILTETIEMIESVIKTMQIQERIIANLRFKSGLTYAEIGNIMGQTRQNINQKIDNILLTIRKRFKVSILPSIDQS